MAERIYRTRQDFDEIEALRAENANLTRALLEIVAVKIGGPHISAEAGFSAALTGYAQAQKLAREALSQAAPRGSEG